MPQIEHNAPKFKYRIYYKLDQPGKTWNIEDIADWRQKELVVENTGTYQRYRMKAWRLNNRESKRQDLVKGVKLCLNPYIFGWLEK